MNTPTNNNTFPYKEFKYDGYRPCNHFFIRPHKDHNDEICSGTADRICSINSCRPDAEQMAKLLSCAPEMLAVLIDLRDGDYHLTGEAWNQIDRVINKATK